MWAPSRAPAQRSHGGSIRRSKSRSAGVNVVITLTVIDKYQAVENNVIVEREFRASEPGRALSGARLCDGAQRARPKVPR